MIAVEPPTIAVTPGATFATESRIPGIRSSEEDLSGSASSVRSIEAVSPSSDLIPVGVAFATPSPPSSLSTVALTLASVTGPFSFVTRTVPGASVPFGKALPRTSKPSTLSTDSLKKLVVE